MTSSTTDKRAFTLVELLAVIAIMAIIVMLAIPALKTIQSTSLQISARQVSNALQLARQYAINNRVPVRLLIAVDTSSGNVAPDLVCRAYTVVKATNDIDGNIIGWIPLQDWRVLPEGIVFSDLNSTSYNTIDRPETPPQGVQNTRILGPHPTGMTNLAWRYFSDTDSLAIFIGGVSQSWRVTYAEFTPLGLARISQLPPSGPPGTVAGIRLMHGIVIDPSNRTLMITDTNNWVYVEYDVFGGRVRTRYPDSYK